MTRKKILLHGNILKWDFVRLKGIAIYVFVCEKKKIE